MKSTMLRKSFKSKLSPEFEFELRGEQCTPKFASSPPAQPAQRGATADRGRISVPCCKPASARFKMITG